MAGRDMRQIMKWARFAPVLLLLLGCDANIVEDPNAESGNDGERGKAQRLAFGEPVNDHITYTEGDMTDWKYIQVPSSGDVTVRLGCDYTGAYCGANVRDEVGRLVSRIRTEGESRVERTLELARGNYYLEIFCPASATDYTVQVDYEPN